MKQKAGPRREFEEQLDPLRNELKWLGLALSIVGKSPEGSEKLTARKSFLESQIKKLETAKILGELKSSDTLQY